MKWMALSLLGLGLSLSTAAQRFGGTPPGVKWQQINTDTVRIIFPEGLDSQANRVASLIHFEAANKAVSLGSKLRKFDVVLQNQTTISNGYVGLGPYRSEFYLTTPTDNFGQGSIPWTDQLSIHEFRHIEQFSNFQAGLSNVMRILFGQEGYALAVNASVPDWFYEGDAVYHETVLSNQGRGRLPQFMNAYPSLWQAGKKYSWMKLRNGSFKDYVPNHYNLGYLLVNYGYQKYGEDFWGKVTTDAAAFKGLIYPFQKAIERHAGISYPSFIKDAFSFYRQPAEKEASGASGETAGMSPVMPLNEKVVTNYLFPYSVSPDSLIYLKTSYNRRTAFVIRDSRGEHYFRNRDISIDQQFSYRNGKLVYSAYETDKRWRWRDYSVIRYLDLEENKLKSITRKSRYFTPDISASGERIVAVENALDGKSELHILSTSDGAVQNRIRSADILTFTDPKFLGEDSIVTAVRLLDGRMALAIADIKDGSTVRITPPSFNVVGYPCISGNKVYFTASYGGRDNIFVIDLSTKVISEMKSDWPLGNYYVNVGAGKITWSSMTAEGFQLQQVEESSAVFEPLAAILAERLAVTYPVARANNIKETIPGNFPLRRFATSRYPAGKNLFNFHSWRPYYEDPEFTFSVYGQNVLNTLETQIYYLYNENEKTHAAGVSAVYGKWFPYLSIGSQYTFNRQLVENNRLHNFDQVDTRVGLSIPLSWVKGRMYKQLSFGTNFFLTNEQNKGFFKDSLGNTSFTYLHHFFSTSGQVEQAVQHFYPRLGYALSLQYRHALTTYTSRQFLGSGAIYVPGFFPTHNLYFNFAWQETGTKDVRFANRFPYPRGYNAAYFARIWGIRSNYHLPLLYPDWGFGNILYLQRFRTNLYFDFARAYNIKKQPILDQRAVGGELFVDTKWWNQYELTFGFRVSKLLDLDLGTGRSGAVRYEFIMPVSIIPR